jgi:hypothetical protein
MMSEEKKYNVEVWGLVYYLSDEDGNPKEDKDGKIILYTNPKDDFSYLSDSVVVDDLEVTDIKENDDDI